MLGRILVGVARNDPTDTGGLFIGRRPGTGPLHYRGDPQRGGAGRQRLDAVLAFLVLVVETLLCLSVWGPQPLAWLWIASQVAFHADNDFLGIASVMQRPGARTAPDEESARVRRIVARHLHEDTGDHVDRLRLCRWSLQDRCADLYGRSPRTSLRGGLRSNPA